MRVSLRTVPPAVRPTRRATRRSRRRPRRRDGDTPDDGRLRDGPRHRLPTSADGVTRTERPAVDGSLAPRTLPRTADDCSGLAVIASALYGGGQSPVTDPWVVPTSSSKVGQALTVPGVSDAAVVSGGQGLREVTADSQGVREVERRRHCVAETQRRSLGDDPRAASCPRRRRWPCRRGRRRRARCRRPRRSHAGTVHPVPRPWRVRRPRRRHALRER